MAIVVFIAVVAGTRRNVIVKAALLQAATIALGFVGALLASPLKVLFFLAGSAAFVGVVYLLVVERAEAAERKDVTTGGCTAN